MSDARVDHIGIAVKSIEQSLEFYRDALGISPDGIVTVPHEQVRVAMLPAGEPHIELLEAMTEDCAVAKFLEKRGEGLHHIAMRVPDLDAAVARMKSAGTRLVNEQVQIGAGGYRYVFIHPKSAGGVLLELIQEA